MMLYVKESPVVAVSVNELVTAGAARLEPTMIVMVPLPEPASLVAVRSTAKVPVAVGVPENTPVSVATVTPEGSPEADQLVGEFVTLARYRNGIPTAAPTVAAVTTGATRTSITVLTWVVASEVMTSEAIKYLTTVVSVVVPDRL